MMSILWRNALLRKLVVILIDYSIKLTLENSNLGFNLGSEGHVGAESGADAVEHTTEDPLLGFLEGGSFVGHNGGISLHIDDIGHVGLPGGLDEHALVDLDRGLQT